MSLNFSDTEIAFRSKTDADLKKAHWLFKSFNSTFLVQKGPLIAAWALRWHFPFMKSMVKGTIFHQFCGGESIDECQAVIDQLKKGNVKSILDYSVEGEENEGAFDHTCEEIIRTVYKAAAQRDAIAFSVFKTTGIVRFALLEKANQSYLKALQERRHLDLKELKGVMTDAELDEFTKAYHRFEKICKTAAEMKVRLFIDAEDSWVQDTIDAWCEEMMERYNKETYLIYTTTQMYRHDRVAYIKRLNEIAEQRGFYIGIKLVRGAYMEKERLRAREMNYRDPIQPDKESCDRDYDDATHFCLSHDRIAICAGTHNEESSMKLARWMEQRGIAPNNDRIFFAQLLGMSDHISFNLGDAGFCVAKYVPYGPVLKVLPYLSRRAAENSSVKGQVGRELNLIRTELKRRHN